MFRLNERAFYVVLVKVDILINTTFLTGLVGVEVTAQARRQK